MASGIERYSATVDQTTATSSGQAYAELLAGAADPISIRRISVVTLTNIGGAVGLARSFAIGTGAATGIATGVCHRAVATTATGPARAQVAWTSSGVTPTGFVSKFRSDMLPVASGQQRTLWDSAIDGPLVVEPGKSLLVVNSGTGVDGGGLRINFTWEEGRF